MTPAEAKRCILIHAGRVASTRAHEAEIEERGFLAALRPYRGLNDESFHELVEAILVSESLFGGDSGADRELVLAIWELCHLARVVGLDSGGLLKRNKLIAVEDAIRLESYVNTIERTALLLLGKSPASIAVGIYANHVERFAYGTNIEYFVSLMIEYLLAEAEEIQDVVSALRRVGARASSALPVLRTLLARTYRLCEPHERYTQEVHAEINAAIQAIENK